MIMVSLAGEIKKSIPETGHLFLFIVSLFFISSCRPKNIDTYPSFSGFPEQNDSISVGTTELWENVHQKVTAGGKSAALILDHGEESLLLRVNLIRSARKSISIQTFSWEFDEVGMFILWELIEANQKRGVKVQLLIDHMFNEHQVELIAYLSTLSDDFEIKYFNPSANKLTPSFLDKISDLAIDFHDHNARLHNKLLVVDGEFIITGGRNINNHYFDEVIGLNYKDRDVLIVQESSPELEKCVSSYWLSEHSVSTFDLIDVNEVLNSQSFNVNFDQAYFFKYDIFQKNNSRANNQSIINDIFISSLINVAGVEWVYDMPDKVEQAPQLNSSVTNKLLSLIEAAQEEILIQSPYVVISKETQAVFRALKRTAPNLKVIVSTNSLAATDNWVTYAANYQEKRVYIEDLGLEIYEFKPIPSDISEMMNYKKLLTRAPFDREKILFGAEEFKINQNILKKLRNKKLMNEKNIFLKTAPYLSLHAKSFVIDEDVTFIGSYNLDPRSEIYNTELGVVIRDKEFAQTLKESIEQDIHPGNSYLVAMKKNRLIVSALNMIMYRISEALPFFDPWPVRPHSCFELKDNHSFVTPDHHDFFQNWKDVGNFPGLSFFSRKQASARIFKAAGMIFKPLL